MKVWILQTGEPLQIDSNGLRPMRAINLSEALIGQGHHVTLWTSDFDHFTKQHRFGSDKTIEFSNQLTIRLIKSRGYKSNIGISRLYDHFQLGWNLRAMMKKEIAPDLGFIGYPPIEPAWVMAKFLEKNRVPSVLDVKDAWPDVMLRSFPIKLRALARFLLFPYFALMKSTFKKCSHLSSISPEFLDWALAISGREAGALDRVNYLASFPPRLKESEVLAAAIFWDSLGVVDDREFRCSYIGSLTSALNLKKVFEAAKQTNFQFVIAGDGSAAKQFKEEAAFFPNIIFPGWITNAQASVLAKRSTVMIAPYKDLEDFNISLPNKFLDAVLLAKPILSSISGFAKVFIEKNNIGRFFSNDVSNSLADLICELSEDAPAIYEMSENAKKIFERELNGDIVYSKLVVHLEEIVKKWNQKEDRNGWGSGERPS